MNGLNGHYEGSRWLKTTTISRGAKGRSFCRAVRPDDVLLREADAAEDGLEARVAAKRVIDRVDLDRGENI